MLEQLLYNYNNDILKQLVKLCEGPSRLARKGELVSFLRKELLSPERLRHHWSRLDELSRKAVSAAYHNEGNFDVDAFAAQYEQLPPRPRHQWYYTFQPILLDLFLPNNQIPAELMPLLGQLVSPPERFQINGVVEAPTALQAGKKKIPLIRAETEKAGLHDLAVCLRLIDQGRLKFSTSSARLTPVSTKLLLDSLLLGDFFPQPEAANAKEVIRPFGLDVFVQGAGLVRAGYAKAGLTEAGKAYLRTQDPELLLEAFEQWSNESAFDEITRLTELKGFRTRGLQLSKPPARRAAIAEALSWCPTGVWISITDFYRALRAWHFVVPIEETNAGSLYYGYRYPYEPWTDTRSYWLLTQGLYTNVVLWEYLGTLGLLDLLYVPAEAIDLPVETYYYEDDSFSRYDGLAYFRITPLGAYLLGQADSYEPATGQQGPLFHLTDDLRLTVENPQALTPNLLHQIETIATQTGDHDYHLETTRLLAHLEAGGDQQGLIDFLAEHNAGPLPAPVLAWFEQTYENSRAVTIGQKTLLIKVRSAPIFDQLLRDEVIGKFATRLDAKTMIIPASKVEALRKRTRQLGYGVRE
jgi:hypothetical protein